MIRHTVLSIALVLAACLPPTEIKRDFEVTVTGPAVTQGSGTTQNYQCAPTLTAVAAKGNPDDEAEWGRFHYTVSYASGGSASGEAAAAAQFFGNGGKVTRIRTGESQSARFTHTSPSGPFRARYTFQYLIGGETKEAVIEWTCR